MLDGEVAIYDQQLRSRFDWLREPDADAVATPPMFMVFDLLYQDGRELTGRPLRERRARLETVVAGGDLVLPVRRLAKNGFEAWSEVIARDYEGYVAKDETSLHEAGPTRRWLKVKQFQLREGTAKAKARRWRIASASPASPSHTRIPNTCNEIALTGQPAPASIRPLPELSGPRRRQRWFWLGFAGLPALVPLG